jgi:hypothetical protein
MGSVRQFAKCAKCTAELSSPFREVLSERLSPTEDLKHLIFSPSSAMATFQSLASVLCVTNRRWLIVFCGDSGCTATVECSYDSTLLVELTLILLYGQLKIDFVRDGKAKSIALHFNSIVESMYLGAIQYILDAIDGRENMATIREEFPNTIFDGWPMKLQNYALLYISKQAQVLDGVWWNGIHGGFGREVAPTAAVLVTDRRIVIISEEKTSRWFQFRHQAKYGGIISYFPTKRLAKYRIEPHPRFCVLQLYGHEIHGGERLDITFPTDKCEAVSRVMGKATQF